MEDFGFTIVSNEDVKAMQDIKLEDNMAALKLEMRKVKDTCAKDILALEKLITPLLHNLLKNPEREMIQWPNREEIIMRQLQKINDIVMPYRS